MNKKTIAIHELSTQDLKKESRFFGIGWKFFAAVMVLIWASLFLIFPSIVRFWLVPVSYPIVREIGTWPILLIKLCWYGGLITGGGYWALRKCQRMQAAQAELKQRRQNTPLR